MSFLYWLMLGGASKRRRRQTSRKKFWKILTCDPSSKGSVLGEGGVICLILTLNCFQYTIVEEIMEFEASRMIRRWSPKIRWCLLACFLTVRFWNHHHQESLENLWGAGVNDRMTIIFYHYNWKKKKPFLF